MALMNKLYHCAAGILLLALLASCKSQLAFEKHTYMREGSGRAVPYELGLPKEESKRMVVFLKDNPDTLVLKDTEMMKYFEERDYNVLIPGKPGESEYQMREMDQKSARVADISGIIYELDSLHQDDLIIIGFGEGGYLTPAVAKNTQALASIIINAGPNSMLSELELLSRADTLAGPTADILTQKNISDQSDLYTRVQNIKDNVNGAEQISPASNYYWLSYYDHPLLEDLNNFRLPLYWVVSEDYPLIAVDSKSMITAMCQSYTNMVYEPLPGKGAFGDKKEMETLVEVMDLFLMKRLSY